MIKRENIKQRLAIGLEYPIGLKGGVGAIVNSLLEDLHTSYSLYLISSEPSDISFDKTFGGFLQDRLVWTPNIPVWSARFTKALESTVQWLLDQRIDILHLHSGGIYGWGNQMPGRSLALAAKRAGISVVWTTHLAIMPLNTHCSPSKPTWMKLALFPIAWLGKLDQIHSVNAEIAVSNHDCTLLKTWFWPKRSHFKQIYHCIMKCSVSRDAILKTERRRIILSIGHIAFRKGQESLVQVFSEIARKHAEWNLVLVGGDSGDGCWQQILQIIETNSLQDRILLTGELNDPWSTYKDASIYVQPSKWEALGLALQEALLHGIPAVTTRSGGITELVLNGVNGGTYCYGDLSEMKKLIIELMNDSNLRKQYSTEARILIESRKMSRELMINEHKQIYSAACRSIAAVTFK